MSLAPRLTFGRLSSPLPSSWMRVRGSSMLPSWSGRKSFSTSYYYNELNGHLKDIGLFNPPRDNAKKLEPLKPGRQKTAEIAPHGRRIIKVCQREIRVSPWQLNLVARQVRPLRLNDAFANMVFSKKKHSSTMLAALRKGCDIAKARYGLLPEQLELDQCFVTRGKIRKGIRIMGRGRSGVARRKWAHLTIHLKEQLPLAQPLAPNRDLGQSVIVHQDPQSVSE